MKISNTLAEQILETSLQIQTKFGVSIGYIHPSGAFVSSENDFVIIQTGRHKINNIPFDIEYGDVYIVEYNEYEDESEGIWTKINPKGGLEQRNERIDNFLIDFYQWITNGQIVIEKERIFIPVGKVGITYSWKPAGDGRFCIKMDVKGCTTLSCDYLENMTDPCWIELREHIQSVYHGNV